MNFRNWYQDEVQSAYYNGTQTTIHGTVNFFRCPNTKDGCREVVTLALVHISADLKHDSFLSCVAMNLTFKTSCQTRNSFGSCYPILQLLCLTVQEQEALLWKLPDVH